MRTLTLILSLVLVACGGGSDHSARPPLRVVAAGDSITLRTGQCASTDSFEACAQTPLVRETAYSSYLPADSFQVLANAGRGGDTCLPAPAFVGSPFNGQARGLLGRMDAVLAARPDAVLVLIGVNDRGLYDTPQAAVVSCVEAVWARARVSGAEPVALTYPPIAASTPVWGLPEGEGKARASALNAAVRAAAARQGVRLVELEALQGYSTTDGTHPDKTGARLIAAQVQTIHF